MNAAERPRAFLPVLGIIQLPTFRKEPLVRNAVVPGQHLKMSRQVHSHELTSDHNRREYPFQKCGRVSPPRVRSRAALCRAATVRSCERIVETAGLTDESVCPTLARIG